MNQVNSLAVANGIIELLLDEMYEDEMVFTEMDYLTDQTKEEWRCEWIEDKLEATKGTYFEKNADRRVKWNG